MGQPRHGSVLTDPGRTCEQCGSRIRKQYASIVWCDCGNWYGNQMGVYGDHP